MKKVLILLGIFWGIGPYSLSNPVSKIQALEVGISYFNTLPLEFTPEVFTVDSIMVNGFVYAWAINFNPQGWVLIASDDKVPPILGFSFSDHFDISHFKNTPIQTWLEGEYGLPMIQMKTTDFVRNQDWDNLKLKSAKSSYLKPFIPVNWNQDQGWNEFCPADPNGPGNHSYAGCVAVAMGQAMSVYQFPKNGISSHGYTSDNYGYLYADYANTTYLWDSMLVNTSNRSIATLLYHLGISVDMDYANNGSGSYSINVPNALKRYFGYYNGMIYKSKSSYTDEQWIALLKAELDAGRPVYYSGDQSSGGGHAFNIDGYYNDSFHFNWGWSGSYNGFFKLSNLNPGGYSFVNNQAAVINIRPPKYFPYDLEISDSVFYGALKANTNIAGIKVSDDTENNSYSFSIWTDSVSQTESDQFFIDHDSIYAKCDLNPGTYTFIIAVHDMNGFHIYRKKNVIINNKTGILDKKMSEVTILSIDNSIEIHFGDQNDFYKLILLDMHGRIIMRKEGYFSGTQHIIVPQGGCYVLRISNPGLILTQKVILMEP